MPRSRTEKTHMYVAYARTMSQNYQSRKYEFGFTFNGVAADVPKAFKLAEAVVNGRLGQKTGLKRGERDDLAERFFEVDFDTLLGREDEEV